MGAVLGGAVKYADVRACSVQMSYSGSGLGIASACRFVSSFTQNACSLIVRGTYRAESANLVWRGCD